MKPKLPCHVAIIMDGNGRWAQEQRKPRILGHFKGRKTAQSIILESLNLKIKYLTLFTFSSENWSRPQKEVNTIIKLCEEVLGGQKKFFHENKIRVRIIGERESLPESLKRRVSDIENETFEYKTLTLILAINYGGRQEIVEACRKIKAQDIKPEDINTQVFEEALQSFPFPCPDLVIRTGRECRMSNFLIWQTAYSELFFSPKMWPEFTGEDLREALSYYEKTERRYGGVNEIHRV